MTARQRPAHQIETGAERLVREKFRALDGKRVGLITNQTGLAGDGRHLADLISAAPNVKLAAILTPEHGFKGSVEAGDAVANGVHAPSGAPVYSLYGSTYRPTSEMLSGIDVLVFDMQDVGVRFYTYISTLGYAMQAAATAGIPFVVLDRPNPLGGDYVSGFTLEPVERSFVGLFEIPIVHGMTVGELARTIQGKSLLPGLEALQLSVIPMAGWERWMRWPDLGREWVSTSPNVASYEAALVYPGMGLLEATSISDGRGTETPFLIFGADWIDGARTAAQLNAAHLPGLRFEAADFTPVPLPGRAASPKFSGQAIAGVRIVVVDDRAVQPLEAGITFLKVLNDLALASGRPSIIDRADWLAKLAGTRRLGAMLETGASSADIIEAWRSDVERFKAERRPYLLYK